MGRNRGKDKWKNKSLAIERREPWPPAGNGTIEKCIAVWKAKGFDVTRDVPYDPASPYRILHVKQIIDSGDEYHRMWYEMDKIKYVLRKINALAKRHGEEYVFREIVKVVTATKGRRFSILTFNVTERYTCVVKTAEAFMYEDHVENVHVDGVERYDLREWKFKPGCPEAPFVVSFVEEDYLSPNCSDSYSD